MKRTRDEICAAILSALIPQESLGITNIMLHAHLSSSYQAEVYLNRLIIQGYIEKKVGQFFILEKGREWLILFHKLKKA